MGQEVTINSNNALKSLPRHFTPADINVLFMRLAPLHPCEGNLEFEELCRQRFPDSLAIFMNKENNMAAYEEGGWDKNHCHFQKL